MLPISGKLSEQYGCRKVFICSVAAFTLASLFCGLADNIYVLVALRALQAVGGAGFTPSATEIIVNYFGDTRDRAVSMFGSIFAIGTMIGPIFGGLFVSYWSWRGIFLVNVPIGVAVIVLALRYVPRDPSRAGAKRSSMDVTGMALLGGGLLQGCSLPVIWLKGSGSMVACVHDPDGHRDCRAVAVLSSHQPVGAPVHRPAPDQRGRLRHHQSGQRSLRWRHFGRDSACPAYAMNRYGIDELHSGTLLIGQGAATILLSRLLHSPCGEPATGCRCYVGGVYCSRDAAAGADPGRGYLAVCVACRCHFTYRNRPRGEQPRGPQCRTATGAGKFLDPCCITNHVSCRSAQSSRSPYSLHFSPAPMTPVTRKPGYSLWQPRCWLLHSP